MSGLWQQWKYRFCTGRSERFSPTWSEHYLHRHRSSIIISSPRVRPGDILAVQTKIDSPCTQREEHMGAPGEHYIVDEHGNRVAVILCREYEQLQEDLHDLAVVAERQEESAMEFDELRKRYER